ILLYLFEVLLVGGPPGAGAVFAFGGALGLAMTTYEPLPLGLYFAGYAWARRVRLRHVALVIAVAAALYFGHLGMQYLVLKMSTASGTLRVSGRTGNGLVQLVRRGDLGQVASLVAHLPIALGRDLLRSFMWAVAVLGVAGIAVGARRLGRVAVG